ncbi:hypothetical protein XENOCAPTIV_019372, partial [Xenoophorus captivus]
AEYRTMAVFILAVIVNSYNTGQGNLIANCLEQLSDPHPLLRQWVAICLGRIWQNFEPARWCGVRDSAHEKLYTLLSDPIPENGQKTSDVLSKLDYLPTSVAVFSSCGLSLVPNGSYIPPKKVLVDHQHPQASRFF